MFCYEEILAANPMAYQQNLKYAEIVFSNAIASQNSLSLLETARKYFAHSLVLVDELKDKSTATNVPRALWGLVKCCKKIQ